MQKVIQLKESDIINAEYWNNLKKAWFVVKYSLITFLIFVAAQGLINLKEFAFSETSKLVQKFHDTLIKTQIVEKIVAPSEIPIRELVQRSCDKYNLHPVILETVIMQESNYNLEQVYKFEPETFASRAKADAKYSDAERRMRASSHGITQVMGFNAQAICGVHWSKLYDPAVAIDCAAKIMRMNLEKAKNLRDAFRMYNGSGDAAEVYANRSMEVLANLLYKQLGDRK